MGKFFLAIAIVMLSACEYLPFSAGPLEGQVVPMPEDWSELSAVEIIQLETNPAEPYSVNLWVAEVNEELYVYAGDSLATWVEHMQQNPEVRLGHDGEIYLLKGRRVIDQALFDQFAEVWKAKYGNHPRNMSAEETYLMLLEPRE